MQTYKQKLNLVTWLLLIISFGQLGASHAAQDGPNLIAVASNSSNSGLVVTSDKFVAWSALSQNRSNTEIYTASFPDLQPFPTIIFAGDKEVAAIDGDLLVYVINVSSQRGGIINAFNLTTKETISVGRGSTASISGDWIVWYGNTAEFEPNGILAYNIRTKAPPIKLVLSGGVRPIVYGTRVVWAESFVNSDKHLNWQIRTIQIGESQPTTLIRGVSTDPNFALDFQGDAVVYVADQKVTWLNMKTKEQKTVAAAAGTVTTDGRFIFWTDVGFDNPNTNNSKRRVDLKGYDTLSSSYFNIAVNNGNNQKVQARKGAVVWLNQLDNQNEIYGAKIISLLPSAAVTATTTTSDRFYFAEVGHTLSLTFKSFWDKSGGLPVFGYPLTEEYTEVNQDTGKSYTVQFLERQRFEYHPENKGTPYEVELGRLGVTDAQRRNLTSTAPFQPSTDKGGTGCSYFTETSHKVCGGFLNYWQNHGLEFGDNGISYREALALFGLPISEEFDDTTGFRTQYFERAVFEYHPENKGAPYEVLLKLLGSSELQNRGWR